MPDLKQYGVLVVGLLMAGGFAFGGMASYSSLIDTGSGGDQQDTVEARMPDKTFQEEPYNLSMRQRMALSLKRDVVIVSAIYNSTEDREKLKELRNLSKRFQGRAYISVVSADESPVVQRYQITNFPSVIMFGYKTSRRRVPATVEGEITPQSVSNVICSSMREWGEATAYCSTV